MLTPKESYAKSGREADCPKVCYGWLADFIPSANFIEKAGERCATARV